MQLPLFVPPAPDHRTVIDTSAGQLELADACASLRSELFATDRGKVLPRPTTVADLDLTDAPIDLTESGTPALLTNPLPQLRFSL